MTEYSSARAVFCCERFFDAENLVFYIALNEFHNALSSDRFPGFFSIERRI